MESSASGYEIKKKLEKIFSHFYNASYGTIYPTLRKMENDGLITKQNVVQEGKPNKNIYTITEKGRQSFYQYLESDIQEVEIKSDFMIRLYFGKFAEPELVIKWMETGIQKTEKSLAKLYAEHEKWQFKMTPTQLICLNIGISNLQNILNNLKEGLIKIKSLTNN
jgi:DNA-binding PadR family transcriptional regulator